MTDISEALERARKAARGLRRSESTYLAAIAAAAAAGASHADIARAVDSSRQNVRQILKRAG